MKANTEMIEGPEAFRRFQNAMRRVLAVPHDVMQRRIAEEKKQAALNPNKRGPKPKAKA